MSKIRGNAAIVGTAESDLGAVAPDMSPIDLMAQGTVRAEPEKGERGSSLITTINA